MILFEILRQPFNKLFKMYENQRQCDFRYLHYTVAVAIFEPFFSKCNSAIYIWHDVKNVLYNHKNTEKSTYHYEEKNTKAVFVVLKDIPMFIQNVAKLKITGF